MGRKINNKGLGGSGRGEWKGAEQAGRSPCISLLCRSAWWPQPGTQAHLLWGLGVWAWEAFPPCSFSSFSFLSSLCLIRSQAGCLVHLPTSSSTPLLPSAYTDSLTATLRPAQNSFFHISHPHHIFPHPHTVSGCPCLGVATLHKVENVRSTLTKIKTCWSLELQCQFGDVRLLENPCLGQEAINQRCNHLHLAHYDMEPHY